MADPLTNTDDLATPYLAYRQTASADDVIARMQERVAAREATAAAPKSAQEPAADAAVAAAPAAAGQPAAQTDEGAGDPAQMAAAVGPGAAAAALDQPATAPRVRVRFAPGTERRGDQAVRSIGADIGRGLIEAPMQALGGVSDAVHNAFTAADHLGDWLNDHVADLSIVSKATFDPLGALAGPKNAVAPAETVTGGLVRDVSRFLTSFIPALRGAKALGMTGAAANSAAVVTASAADAITRDPTDENLSNLLRDHAGLKDPITAYLAADPNDGEATARFKKGLEGLGLGAIGEGMVYAMRAVRAARLAGKPGGAVVDELEAARNQHGEVTDRDFLILGDMNKPMLEAAPEPVRGNPGEKLAEAAAATEQGPAAQKLTTLANRAQKAQAAMERADGAPRTLDDLERVGAEQAEAGHKAVLDVIDELKAGPADNAQGLTSWLVKNGGVQNQGGEVSHIIGSRGKTRPGLIAGKGMTLDDAALKAWEDGFFPELGERPTVGEFLDALRGDHDTTAPRFHKDDWAAREHTRYLQGVEQELDQAGIDWRNQDRDALAKQLDDFYDRDKAALQPRTEDDLTKQVGEMPRDPVPADLGGNKVAVNFARIQGPDDVKALMGAMADQFAGKVDQARRGVQSHEQTQKLADELGMSVADLLARRHGQPFNAEEAVAARQLWTASTEKLLETARLAAQPNAGDVDQFNFRRMMGLHYAVQAEVLGARAEAARSTASWAIPVGGSVERARAVQDALAAAGGPAFSKEMAKRLAALADAGVTADALSTFTRRSWAATTLGAVQEAWINALLSNPKTHVVNMTSNWLAATTAIFERQAAENLSAIRGGTDGVAPGEAAALAYGMVTGLKDAFRLAWQATRAEGAEIGMTGQSAALTFRGKLEGGAPAIGSQAFGIASDTSLGRAVDFIGQAARIPGRMLNAEDAFFKSIGYRMEVHAQSLRQATQEGLEGEALYRRVAQIANDPPEHIRLAAADAALYQTFANKTGSFGDALMVLRDKVPMAPFVLPFVRTPTNIARYAFERSPVAPLVGQWRADIEAGGARRDLALARMSTGTAIMAVAADYADAGLISGNGPKDVGEREAQERQGWTPYSIKVGNAWYEYNRLDPLGMLMGFSADMSDLVRRGDIHPEQLDEINEVIGAGIAAVARTVINKTYMQGTAQLFQMLEDGERFGPAYIQQFASSFVPAIVNAAKNADDPTQREAMKIWDSVIARLPVIAGTLMPRRDLWGGEKRIESGNGAAYDALSPVRVSPVKASPIDAELQRLGFGPERIAKRVDWDGVPVNFRDWPQVYDAYQRLAGNELKNPAYGKGAKDFLDEVVTGKSDFSPVYKLGQDTQKPDDGGKAAFIQRTINQYRKDARAHIEADPQFAEFTAFVNAGRGARQTKQMPAIQ